MMESMKTKSLPYKRANVCIVNSRIGNNKSICHLSVMTSQKRKPKPLVVSDLPYILYV